MIQTQIFSLYKLKTNALGFSECWFKIHSWMWIYVEQFSSHTMNSSVCTRTYPAYRHTESSHANGTIPGRLQLTRHCLSGHLWLCMCEWESKIERVSGFLCHSVDLLVSSLLFCYFLWGRGLLLAAFVSWMKRAQFIMSPCDTPSSSGSPGKPTCSKVRRKVRLWLWKTERERESKVEKYDLMDKKRRRKLFFWLFKHCLKFISSFCSCSNVYQSIGGHHFGLLFSCLFCIWQN